MTLQVQTDPQNRMRFDHDLVGAALSLASSSVQCFLFCLLIVIVHPHWEEGSGRQRLFEIPARSNPATMNLT